MKDFHIITITSSLSSECHSRANFYESVANKLQMGCQMNSPLERERLNFTYLCANKKEIMTNRRLKQFFFLFSFTHAIFARFLCNMIHNPHSVMDIFLILVHNTLFKAKKSSLTSSFRLSHRPHGLSSKISLSSSESSPLSLGDLCSASLLLDRLPGMAKALMYSSVDVL
jgi:hypothetical protein